MTIGYSLTYEYFDVDVDVALSGVGRSFIVHVESEVAAIRCNLTTCTTYGIVYLSGDTIIIIIIIIAKMTVFNVAGYLIEERRRWPAIYCLPTRTIFQIYSEFEKKGIFR